MKNARIRVYSRKILTAMLFLPVCLIVSFVSVFVWLVNDKTYFDTIKEGLEAFGLC